MDAVEIASTMTIASNIGVTIVTNSILVMGSLFVANKVVNARIVIT